MIYYAQPIIGGPVKIGFTDKRRVRDRIAELQVSIPWKLVVLLSHGGSRGDEACLHEHFQHLRVQGEWFEPGDDLTYWIMKLGGMRPMGAVPTPKWHELKKVQRADGRKWVKTPVYLAESQTEWLDRHCKERQRDVSAVIHDALREYVAKVG